MAIKRDTRSGTKVTIKANGLLIDGKQAELVRVSDRTGVAVVKLLENCGCYQTGDTLHLGCYELEISR